jgi:UDP-N-acetylglucosamine acyltransferase
LAKIHPLAYVDPRAELADDVEVGPFCFVEANVVIGAGCRLESHISIRGNTTLGENNVIAHGAVLGGDPQDAKYKGEPTYLRIGDRNIIREYVTIHRATGEENATVIGNDNFIMSYCHLAHNVTVENMVTMANSVQAAGHVTIEERAILGGLTGIHQFTRIGKIAMVGGMSRITRDVPPFMLVEGPDQVHDINAIGLRRIGITPDARLALHKACKLLFKSMLGLTNAMDTVRRELPMTAEVEYLLAFEERRFKGKHGRGDQH